MLHDYNTQRKKMTLPEYGRNVQKMIDHIKTIEDREERNRAAKTIIQVMGNFNTHLRDIEDFKHKLWDHLEIIANFELDID
jgi:CRISPR/Cas system-associated endonuclease Cas1